MFDQLAIEKAGWYVYCYRDPHTKKAFYVGKGTGNRCFSHLNDKTEKRKVAAIRSIQEKGLSPTIELIAHGLPTEELAYTIEMAVIGAIGLEDLTNEVSGHHTSINGRIRATEFNLLHAAAPLEISEPAILIRLTRTFDADLSANDLYHATRGIWKVSQRRIENRKFALAIHKGIVREVYAIDKWFKAGSTLYPTRTFEPERLVGRLEFVGEIASPKYRDSWLGKKAGHLIPENAQNPIRYVN